MPVIDVVDSSWVPARPAKVAAAVADPRNWRRWWPELDLVAAELRGMKGVRWTVRRVSGRGAGLVGSAEVWLEPVREGVVAHFFLRLDPANGRAPSARQVARITDHYRRRAKQAFWQLADELDPGRLTRLTSTSSSRPAPR